jgi:hypothetical protein
VYSRSVLDAAGASAVWGDFQQQIFLTRSREEREEREGKEFFF